MDQQELHRMLEEMMFSVMQLRQQQVQFLAESKRNPEDKIHFRKNGNEAWQRYKELHQHLADMLVTSTPV